MKAFFVLAVAIAVIAAGWAINPGIGVLAAFIAYAAVDGLLSE